MSKKNKREKKATYTTIYVVLVTCAILLVLLIGVLILRLQGYQTFSEWLNRNEQQVSSTTITPAPTQVGDVGDLEEKEPVPSIEATITLEPTKSLEIEEIEVLPVSGEGQEIVLEKLEKLGFYGQEEIDKQIREQVKEFGKEEDTLVYESYLVGNYFSAVFRKMGHWNGTETEFLLPLVYDITTNTKVTGSDLIKETYFCIIK